MNLSPHKIRKQAAPTLQQHTVLLLHSLTEWKHHLNFNYEVEKECGTDPPFPMQPFKSSRASFNYKSYK